MIAPPTKQLGADLTPIYVYLSVGTGKDGGSGFGLQRGDTSSYDALWKVRVREQRFRNMLKRTRRN